MYQALRISEKMENIAVYFLFKEWHFVPFDPYQLFTQPRLGESIRQKERILKHVGRFLTEVYHFVFWGDFVPIFSKVLGVSPKDKVIILQIIQNHVSFFSWWFL